MKYKRIFIFGGTASGKTTLAEKLSTKFKIPYYSIDDFIYKKGWKLKYTDNQRDKKLKQFSSKKKWIIEGVQRGDWILPAVKKADFIIILSLPKYILLTRILTRELKRRFQKHPKKSDLRDTLTLIKYAYIYKHDNFIHHQRLTKEHNKEFVILESKKQINKFVEELK